MCGPVDGDGEMHMRFHLRDLGPGRRGQVAAGILALALGLLATAGVAHAGTGAGGSTAANANQAAGGAAAIDPAGADAVRRLEATVSERVAGHRVAASGAPPA